MRKSDLIPVRVKRDTSLTIGDEKRATGGYQGVEMTKDVVWATAESLLKQPKLRLRDRRAIAQCIDDEILEFDSYTEEAESPVGRNPITIAVEDGVEAYEELEGQIEPNPFIYACVYEIPVMDAVHELDRGYHFVVQADDMMVDVHRHYGYDSSHIVQGTIEYEGEEYSNDYRTFVPDAQWTLDALNATDRNQYSPHTMEGETDFKLIEEFAKEVDPKHLKQCAFNRSKGSTIVHYVRGIIDSPVENESSELKFNCGRTIKDSKVMRIVADVRTIDTKTCGNCDKT